MSTLDSLKRVLKEKASETTSTPTNSLSDAQYEAGFDILTQGAGWCTYQDFIIPQLTRLLTPLFTTRTDISVLEIGPGPKSVLGHLSSHLRQKITVYKAFEPNQLHATKLEKWLSDSSDTGCPFPLTEGGQYIFRAPFTLNTGGESSNELGHFDVVLFCHSMHGLKPKRRFIEKALSMLHEQFRSGLVVVFHRDGSMHLDGLVCHQTASFPTGAVHVPDENEALDCFAPFIAGFVMKDEVVDKSVREAWRQTCRTLGDREESHPDHLAFSAPETMTAFTQHATALPELIARVPLVIESKTIKSQEARRHQPAAIIRPTEIGQVQDAVRWALKNKVGLTVVGGGHSGHCLVSNAVSVDMGAFKKVHVAAAGGKEGDYPLWTRPWVVVEAGCKAGDIVENMQRAGLTIPMGSRPSVGAGLWLQGGIGHQSRQLGLTCDAIVGAVVVSVDSAEVFCVGNVPDHLQPANSVIPEEEKKNDLLWALKGAGTNFGIVVSVVFEASWGGRRQVHEWLVPISQTDDAKATLMIFATLSKKAFLDMYVEADYRHSADAYLFWDNDQLHLGVTLFESPPDRSDKSWKNSPICEFLGMQKSTRLVDDVGLFDSDMYLSSMHGGHGGGKTCSFKRCLFLKSIDLRISAILIEAIETRPSQLCYLHLLPGRGAISKVAADETAFGCRDWDYACVITGIWPRDEYDSKIARSTVQWVYEVARKLLPLSDGVYGADLGPDPRDAELAAKAFGPNLPRLARLKQELDPQNVLAYACPLPRL